MREGKRFKSARKGRDCKAGRSLSCASSREVGSVSLSEFRVDEVKGREARFRFASLRSGHLEKSDTLLACWQRWGLRYSIITLSDSFLASKANRTLFATTSQERDRMNQTSYLYIDRLGPHSNMIQR